MVGLKLTAEEFVLMRLAVASQLFMLAETDAVALKSLIVKITEQLTHGQSEKETEGQGRKE